MLPLVLLLAAGCVLCALVGYTLRAAARFADALPHHLAWCARWLYPEYTIPLLLGLVPLGLLLWACLR